MAVNPKYRNLTQEEFRTLEKEFIEFLVMNGIVADDWEKIKSEDPDKAKEIMTLFSDVIIEGSLRKIEYLEGRSKSKLHIYQCLSDKIVLVGMSSENDEIDFTDPESALDLGEIKGVKVYTTSKSYDGVREKEIFQMLSNGCLISDGALFKKLCMFL